MIVLSSKLQEFLILYWTLLLANTNLQICILDANILVSLPTGDIYWTKFSNRGFSTIVLNFTFFSVNTDKVQRIWCYEMSLTLTSKSNRRAALGCDTFDYVESHIDFVYWYFMTKFEIPVKLMCNYCQNKNQRNWLSDKNLTALVHKLFDHS